MKGDWKCTYFLNEKDVDEKEIVTAIESLIARKYVEGNEGLVKLSSEIKRTSTYPTDNKEYKAALVKEAQQIVESDWFKQVYNQSKELAEFYSNYKILKN